MRLCIIVVGSVVVTVPASPWLCFISSKFNQTICLNKSDFAERCNLGASGRSLRTAAAFAKAGYPVTRHRIDFAC
jgi:hypothetical protein